MSDDELRARLISILRVAGALALVGLAIAVWIARRGPVERSSDAEFAFDARSIGEFHCSPTGPGHHPAVLLLHGAGYRGMGHDDFETMCSALADRGYYAEFIEYFDAASNSDPTDAMDNFRTWTAAIHAGITSLARNSAIDPTRIAVMGFSQGAYLAVGCGAIFPNDIAAVVEYYGGLVPTLRDKVTSMPPTLIIHGEADTIIPVAEAKELDAILTRAGRPREMHLYPGVEHGFNFHGISDWYNRDAANDAWRRALEFLDRTLRLTPSPLPSREGG